MNPEQFLKLLAPPQPRRCGRNHHPGCDLLMGATLQIFTVKRPHKVETNRYIPLRNIAQIKQATAA